MTRKLLAGLTALFVLFQILPVLAEDVWNFDNKLSDGWTSWENKSHVSDGAYQVESYSYMTDKLLQRNYKVTFDACIQQGQSHNPAVYLRADAKMNGYRFDFDADGGTVTLSRVDGEKAQTLQTANLTFDKTNSLYAEVNAEKISFGSGDKEILAYSDYNSVKSGSFAADCGDGKLTLDNITFQNIVNSEDEYYIAHPSEDYKRSPYAVDIEKAVALGFMERFEDGSFKPALEVTRGELAGVIAEMANAGNGHNVDFMDMTSADPYYNEAAYCVSRGYIRTREGSFCPDELASWGDAVRVMTLLTGRRLLENTADKNENYYIMAKQAGIIRTFPKSEVLSREQLACLVINTAECDMVELISVGSSVTYGTKKGKNLLSEYHDIYKLKGRVEQNSRSGLYSAEGCGDDEVKLAGYTVKTEDSDIGEYLGYYVSCYGTKIDDDIYCLVWFGTEDKYNRAVTVAAEDIAPETTTECLRYYNNDKIKSVDLPKNLVYIYNGVVTSPSDDILKPEIGSVTLICDNGKYFAAIIRSFDVLYVGSVSYYTGEIRDKYFDDKMYTLDDKNTYTIYSDGKKVPLTQIFQNRVLSIAESAGEEKYYTVYVSAARAEGVFERETEKQIRVSGKDYRLLKYGADLYTKGLELRPKLGTSVTAYLDYFGNLAFMLNESFAENLGYLHKIAKSGIFDVTYKARIFKTDGEWETMPFASKIKMNGMDVSCRDSLPSALYKNDVGVPQIIMFRRNAKGEIIQVDTALKGAYGQYPITVGKTLKNKKYVSANTSFDTDVYVDYRTIVFNIPPDTNDERRFVSSKRSYFKDGGFYDVTCFNIDEYDISEIVVVQERAVAEVPVLPRMFVVNSVEQALLDDGEVGMVISGYRTGKKTQLSVAETAKEKFAALQCGDAVFLAENNAGEAVDYEKCCIRSDGMVGSNNSTATQSVNKLVVKGTVTKLNMTDRRARVNVGNAEKAYYLGNAVSVYTYYSKRDMLEVSDITNLDAGDYIVCNFCWNKLNDIVIYKP